MLKCLGLERAPEEDGDEGGENSQKTSGAAGSSSGASGRSSGRSRNSAHEGGGASTVNTESTDEEMESRLSRRSSVLVDLLSLFRRSSSFHVKAHRVHGGGEDVDDEDDDEDDTRNMTKEKILEAIRYKKEIIGKLKSQPWNMKRKRRTLKVARRHLQRQEAKVSRVRLYKAEIGRRITQMNRWLDNFKIYLIPWEAKIKRIESHFGSVVSSYFTFLRWTLGVNIVMSVIMLLFVIVPEWLADSRAPIGTARYNKTMHLKVLPEDVRRNADMLSTVWDFGGHLQQSLLFYGFYSRETFFGETVQYRVPVAYFLVNIVLLAYSFFIILRRMAANARTSKLASGKTEQYVFNWKSFTGWDYTIGNAETAGNVHMANVIKFREAIAEYNVKLKEKFRWLQIAMRVFANIIVFMMLAFSVWAILAVSAIKDKDTFLTQNAVSITVSFITLIFPNIFELIGKIEQYHPRFALRIQLARVLCLYIVNYYTLIVSLMFMLNDLEEDRKQLQKEYQTEYQRELSHYQAPYDYPSRSLRQLVGLFNNSLSEEPFTTPAAPSPWTTVFSDYGPIGVQNPKAVVSRGKANQTGTVFISQIIGPNLNWNTSAPVRLNYTGTETVYAQPIRRRQYGDLCWETIIGQEITKVITMDLLMTIAAILFIDFFRGLFVRYCNPWWCWNLEKTFPEYGEFKVAENVLHLVNNQGMIWLGLFFVPMLPFLNNIKLIILMYVRAWACMTCNVPARQIFRASRSSNFYLMLLLLMLFLCTLPVGYVIASKSPSKTCGPFADQPHFYSVIMDVLNENLPSNLVEAIRYMSSPGIVIPVLLLLLLIIYFLFALVRGLREANSDLSSQLMHERTEEKKKIFELAGGKKQRDLIFDRKSKKKNDKKSLIIKQYSSDEESHAKSIASVPRSIAGRQFVPSLGSVSEVDHSDVEEESHEETIVRRPTVLKPKLTLRQKFLVCIGWADPKMYEELPQADEQDIERGHDTGYYNEQESGEDHDEEERSREEERDAESRHLLSPHRNNGSRSPARNSQRGHSKSPRSVGNSKSGRSSGEDEHSAKESFRTASRGSSTGADQSTKYEEPLSVESDSPSQSTPHQSVIYATGAQLAEPGSHFPRAKSAFTGNGSPARLVENPLFYSQHSERKPKNGRDPIGDLRRSSGSQSSSVSQSYSLPAVEIQEMQPSSTSNKSSDPSESSYKQAAQSLLEPINRNDKRKRRDYDQESSASMDRTRPPSNDGSFRDAHSSRQPSTPMEQLAQIYANPHNSYTSAMMSPIMADYSVFSTTEESDGNDESAHLLPTRMSASSSKKPKQTNSGGSSLHVRPPRFRISSSPPRKRLENYDSDSSQRRFELRIGGGAIAEVSESSPERTTPSNGKKEVQTTTV